MQGCTLEGSTTKTQIFTRRTPVSEHEGDDNDSCPSERTPLLEPLAEDAPLKTKIWSGRKSYVLSVVCVSLFVTYLPESLLQPFFPLYSATELGFDHPQIATILSLPPLFGALFTPLAAKLSSEYGRVPMWCSGSFLMVCTMVSFAFSTTFYLMCFIRVVQGFCVSLVNVSTQSLVTAVFAKRKAEAMSIYQTSLTLSFTVGPTMGGILFDMFGFRWMFLLNGLLAFFPLCGCMWLYIYHMDILSHQRTFVQEQTRFVDVLTWETLLGAFAWTLLYANFTYETLLEEHLFLTLHCSAFEVGMIIFLQAITTIICVKKVGEYCDRNDGRWLIPSAFALAAGYHLLAGPPPFLNFLFDGYWVMLITSCSTLVAQGFVAAMLLPSAYSFIAHQVMKSGVDGTEEQVALIMVFLEGFGFTVSTMFAGGLMSILPKASAPNCSPPGCETAYAYVMEVYTILFFSAAVFLWKNIFKTEYEPLRSEHTNSLSEL